MLWTICLRVAYLYGLCLFEQVFERLLPLIGVLLGSFEQFFQSLLFFRRHPVQGGPRAVCFQGHKKILTLGYRVPEPNQRKRSLAQKIICASGKPPMPAVNESVGRVIRAFLTRPAGRLPVWAWCAIAFGVLLAVILGVTLGPTGTAQSAAMPASLTITWTQNGSTQFPIYVIPGAKYARSSSTSLSANLAAALPNATVLASYTYAADVVAVKYSATTPVVFVKYVDADQVRRFALVADITGVLSVVYTTDDVGSLANPAEYAGTWTYVSDGSVILNRPNSLQFG
jgi:hypothetical protein